MFFYAAALCLTAVGFASCTAEDEAFPAPVVSITEEEVAVPDFVQSIRVDLYESNRSEVENIIDHARNSGVHLTTEQASRINSLYYPRLIQNAIEQCNINNITTYYGLKEILEKLENAKEKVNSLRYDLEFKKVI